MGIPDFSLVKIILLGRFEIHKGEKFLRAADWKRQKAASLLKRLAYERKLLKDQAIDFLWPDADLTSGANNLYRTLHALRATLNETLGEGTADQVFTFSDSILTLSSAVWVDAHEYESQISNHQFLISNYSDFLPDDRYEDWTQIPRENLFRLYREAVLTQAGSVPASAPRLLTPLLARNPLDEPAHRALMHAYALSGRRHDALRQYQTCVDALETELGITPDPLTTALYQQIMRGELLPLPQEQPRPASLPPIPIHIELEKKIPLVGRQKELEFIHGLMNSSWKGIGEVILLAGDTGVGKTRLAYEALGIAASAGMATLLGACYEQEGQLPYQPFIEAFNRYLAEQGLPAEQNPITHFKRLGVSDPQQEQGALFNATAGFLYEIARQKPVVVLVDDLHAADQTSLSLFHYLARQSRSFPLILITTYRIDIAPTITMPFGALLNALYRERLGERLTVERLGVENVAEIISHILEGSAHAELIHAVYEITEGNPFFAHEMVHTLVKNGLVEKADGIWQLVPGANLQIPPRLSELLRARVSRLGPEVETMLTTGAVLGREFQFNILCGLSGLSEGDTLTALDLALSSHLLEETEAGYRFHHALIRHTLYESLSQGRRALLHRQAAETIEALYFANNAARPDKLQTQVETLAYHFALSDRLEQALPYLLQAGQKAADLYAFEVAVDYFEQALRLMDRLGLDNPAQKWQILEALGWWGVMLADTPRAVARFEAALALPASENWQPARRARASLHRAATMALITAGNIHAAEAHLKAALAEIDPQEDVADYALVLYTVAQFHWHRNEYQEAFDAAQHSLSIAEHINDEEGIARAFEMLALACHSLGEWQAGLQFEERRASLAGHGLDVTGTFDVHL
ncbi:MAG: AAA family ATPase [Anaerolineales bacterium]